MNLKFGIGVVVAIVMQVSAFVWWTAQQAQTIDTLKQQVSELTSRMAVEDEITMKRDLADLKNELQQIKIDYNYDQKMLDIWMYIDSLVAFATFTENRWANEYTSDNTYERQFGEKPPSEK